MIKKNVVLVSLEWDIIDLISHFPSYELIGFFDISSQSDSSVIPWLGRDESWLNWRKENLQAKVILGIDPPKLRRSLFSLYGEKNILSLISPLAYVSSLATLGDALIIQHRSTIMPKVSIGKGSKIHIGAAIHHEAVIGEFVTIAPGAIILGSVMIGSETYIGAGAIIKQNCKIGKNVVIGAGAVVITDIPDAAVVAGNPSRPIQR